MSVTEKLKKLAAGATLVTGLALNTGCESDIKRVDTDQNTVTDTDTNIEDDPFIDSDPKDEQNDNKPSNDSEQNNELNDDNNPSDNPDNKTEPDDNQTNDDNDNVNDDDPQNIVGEDEVPADEADKIQNQNNVICARLPNSSFVPGVKKVTPNGNVSFVDTCITTIGTDKELVYIPDFAPHLFYLARLDLNTPHKIVNMVGKLDASLFEQSYFHITANIKIKNLTFESNYQNVDVCFNYFHQSDSNVLEFYSSPPTSTCNFFYSTTKNFKPKFTKNIIANNDIETVQQKNAELCKKMPNSIYTPNTETTDDGTTITDTCSITINDKIWFENVIPFLFERGKINWVDTPYRIPYIEQRRDIENDTRTTYIDIVLNNMTLQVHLNNTEVCLSNPNSVLFIDAEIAPSATDNDNCIRHDPSASLYNKAKKQKWNMAQSMLWTKQH